MLAITISWIVIIITIFPLGLFSLNIYHKLSKKKLDYTIVDVFLIGIGVVLFPVSVISLFFPIDFKVLLFVLFLSAISIISNKNYIASLWNDFKKSISGYSKFYVPSLVIIVLAFLIIPIWFRFQNYDPLFYHYSNIKWNESFSVIPGLANLEERFGFNSNYLLLCSLFSLRIIFGDLIIGIQSLLAVIIACWIMNEMVKTNFELRRVILFVLYILFVYTNKIEISTSSTDIIPNLAAIYLFTNIILYPNRIRSSIIYIFTPIVLVTFKLSNIFLLLIGLYPLVLLVRYKDYKTIAFILITGSIVIIPWLIRNVIISGYLVFPYWKLDLFHFDWKVPLYIPQNEQIFITEYARNKFSQIVYSPNLWVHNISVICTYL